MADTRGPKAVAPRYEALLQLCWSIIDSKPVEVDRWRSKKQTSLFLSQINHQLCKSSLLKSI